MTNGLSTVDDLFVADFEFADPSHYDSVVKLLSLEPSCLVLDNVNSLTGLVVVYKPFPEMRRDAQGFYSKLPSHRVPQSFLLKHDGTEIKLGGPYSWIKMRCPKSCIDELRKTVATDRRVAETLWSPDSGWLYSRVKIPEIEAADELKDIYVKACGSKGFRYLPVIRSYRRQSLYDNMELTGPL